MYALCTVLVLRSHAVEFSIFFTVNITLSINIENLFLTFFNQIKSVGELECVFVCVRKSVRRKHMVS